MHIELIVGDVPSPYNAILGRTWLHGKKAFASTYHQVVQYILAFEDKKIYSVTAKSCYVNIVHRSKMTSRINLIEVSEAPVLEDVKKNANEKLVEDLQTVPFNEHES